MKIVIDIDEKDYQSIKNGHIPFSVLDVLMNGTPLPEHHGRLIDADYMIKQLLSLPKDELSTEDMWAMKVLDLAPTILEAEGSDSE